jgi:outer membrane protein
MGIHNGNGVLIRTLVKTIYLNNFKELMGMRSRKTIGMALGLILVGCVGLGWAADTSKIGVVDFQKILEESTAGKAAKQEISRQGEKMEGEIKKSGQDIEALESQLEKEQLVMERDKLEEKKRDIRIKVGDLKSMQKKYTEDFQKLEARIIQKIQKDVFSILKDMGQKEGFTMILERRAGGVAYFEPSVDITDEVLNEYNDKVAKGTFGSPTDVESDGGKQTGKKKN